MQTATSARTYTTRRVKPLLAATQAHNRDFLPQTVPAYAATETFHYRREAYADYAYKEATLNPANLRDRPVEWAADIVNTFRNHPDRRELAGRRETPTGASLFRARPIAAGPPCLECHGHPRGAPPGSGATAAPTALAGKQTRSPGRRWSPSRWRFPSAWRRRPSAT